ncbi:MAG TPA: lactonase family protein [Aggregatilineales bacterium]|nr:lactonase family protein [Aggregatilineales bacterium]
MSNSTPEKTLLYVGTYTQPLSYHASAKGKGIYVYEFDAATGTLTPLHEVEGIDNPSYLAIDSQKRWLYAISEVRGWKESTISAYGIDKSSGKITYLNKQVTQGVICAYVTVDHSDHYVLLVNWYEGKNAAVLAIREDGGLAPTTCTVEYSGIGVNNDRPHSHCIELDPSNRYAYIAEMGLDKIMIYQFDTKKGCLMPNTVPSVDLEPGSGPRHFVFHPNGKFAYLIQETIGTITAFSHDAGTGALLKLQTISALPPGYSGPVQAADIHVIPSGKFLYASIRKQNSIAIFAVDEKTGLLAYIENQPTKGQTPRNFAIDPSGTFLLVANQDSDKIVVFKINQKYGRLEETGQVADCPTPACLKMIQTQEPF